VRGVELDSESEEDPLPLHQVQEFAGLETIYEDVGRDSASTVDSPARVGLADLIGPVFIFWLVVRKVLFQ